MRSQTTLSKFDANLMQILGVLRNIEAQIWFNICGYLMNYSSSFDIRLYWTVAKESFGPEKKFKAVSEGG